MMPLRRRRSSLTAIAALSLLFAAPGAPADGRPTGNWKVSRPPGTQWVAEAAATADELLQCLLGPDVTASNVTLVAPPHAAGTFTGALSVVGFDRGVILSSGDVLTLVGPNLADSTSTDNAALGDADLDALIPGYTTYDAVVLEFEFTCATAQDVVFQYTFGSEEYNEYVDTPFNDVFGFFLNGVNIAVAPAGCSAAGAPVSINNVNCGNPYVGAGPNCNCFRNNDLQDGGGAIDSELDGFTQVFHATGKIESGKNRLKIALADAGDHVLDSDVMIRCQSFTCGAAPVTGACCLPAGTCVTLTSADCGANGGTYHGDGISCVPSPCGTSTGACCKADTSCEVESPSSCAAVGGTYQGDTVACVPNPCGAPTGACCFGAGACEISDPFTCLGDYVGDGTKCSPDPCGDLTGACCADAAICEAQTPANCGDVFLGIGTNCDPNPCEAIVGACCHDTGACDVTLGVDCGDLYLGDRTTCEPNLCLAAFSEIFRDGFELGNWSRWSDTAP